MEGVLTDTGLRVLIVDDEYYFRKLLVNLIDWNALGYEIASEAEDGLEALELACKEHFHLIIADINMPRLTGLDFAKELRASNKETKIIFITSHDEFQYAKLAIALGASNYLMKPVDEVELEDALNEIRDQIGQMQASKRQAELALPILGERFVRQLLLNELQEPLEAVQKQANDYNIAATDNGYAVIIVQIDELHVRFEQERDRRECYGAVKNMIAQKLQPLGSCYAVVDGDEDNIIILAGVSEAKEILLSDYCELARSLLDSALPGIPCTFSFGKIYKQMNEVHLSYAEALYMLKRKFVEGGNRVFDYYSQTREHASHGVIQPLIIRNDWLKLLRNRDVKSINESIDELIRMLVETRASKDRAILALMECISIGSAAILERYESLPAQWMSEEHPHFRQIRRLETVFGVEQWIRDFFLKIVFRALDGQENLNRRSDIVHQAMVFVSENFMNEGLNLQQTAKELFVNPSYLSHLFKKEAGKSFVEYLSDLRLERAMELLKSSSDKMADIASQVGYSDPYYFSKCFKKKFGVAPKNL
ncbi:response regulator [Paenibacillus beijingensis]|uniref:AraC family transcriptional regulator n=1 Tax=Paenibacillus beijingensis TaxID=1126833 RepID=A0A0D5NLQ2_9BACL|nr:response regulator [Paenibacillus beijingensis]AJY76171.1 hypothetical protein VN24_18405 [Paenibacillus beijingensis]